MSAQKKVDEQFLRMSMEHTLILEAIRSFEEILSKPDAPQSFLNLKEKMKTFEKDCEDHFNLEEKVLFPAALACLSSLEIVDTVLLMQKEHGYLERDLDDLLTLIQNQPKKMPTIPEEIQDPFISFCALLKEHADVEMEDIFRPMDESRHCRKFLKGFMIQG